MLTEDSLVFLSFLVLKRLILRKFSQWNVKGVAQNLLDVTTQSIIHLSVGE